MCKTGGGWGSLAFSFISTSLERIARAIIPSNFFLHVQKSSVRFKTKSYEFLHLYVTITISWYRFWLKVIRVAMNREKRGEPMKFDREKLTFKCWENIFYKKNRNSESVLIDNMV